MADCCDIWQKFKVEELLLKKYNHWSLLIRRKQPMLGCCVAILNRHAEEFSEVTEEEFAEFSKLTKDIETALKKAFECEKINYLALMLKDKHVHFHIIPRYSKEKKFAGGVWIDASWPKAPVLLVEEAVPEVLQKIKEEITKNLQ